jgi:hypothetical protein
MKTKGTILSKFSLKLYVKLMDESGIKVNLVSDLTFLRQCTQEKVVSIACRACNRGSICFQSRTCCLNSSDNNNRLLLITILIIKQETTKGHDVPWNGQKRDL